MSVALNTGANFTVVRQITNHLDTGTYYVRAVIRNAYTDAIIATLDLEDKGSQRFKKDWKVPNDPSGEGFYVSIVTSVYSDSGYASKSENYGDEENTYLVQDRLIGGRSGGGTDYSALRRIIREELEKKLESFEISLPEMRWDEILRELRELRKLAKKKPEALDLSPVVSAIGLVLRTIREKKDPEPADLSPVVSQLSAISNDTATRHKQIVTIINTLEEGIANDLRTDLGQIVQKSISDALPADRQEEAVEPQLNLKKLAS